MNVSASSRPRRPRVEAPPDVAVPIPEVTDGVLQIPLELPPLTEPTERVGPLDALRHDITAFFHRAQASDLATGVHVASTGGGGRIATVAAVLGLCLSGAGVGTVCVVTGLVPQPAAPAPRRAARTARAAATERREAARRPNPRRRRRSSGRHRRPPDAGGQATHGQAQARAREPRSAPRTRRRRATRARRSRPLPTHSTGQDTFTPESQQGSQPATRAPATGGSEFAP